MVPSGVQLGHVRDIYVTRVGHLWHVGRARLPWLGVAAYSAIDRTHGEGLTRDGTGRGDLPEAARSRP